MGNSTPKLVVITGLTAVLFFFGLLVTERFGEIPVDVDWKPFFIPFLFVALLPMGPPAWAVGLGAALGEGFGDILEGYEIDDPFGFFGYIICFGLAGYIIRNRPRNWLLVSVACIVGAFIQALIEALTFFVFGLPEVSSAELPGFLDFLAGGSPVLITVWATIGNTITHGVILGLIPLLILIPLLYGRIERLLGFAPVEGTEEEEEEEEEERSAERARRG